MIPDEADCRDLWEKAKLDQRVIEHVQAVAKLAQGIATHVDDADATIVLAGALLHDVGRGFTHDVDHVPQGVAFLEEAGVDEAVISCVACHMGAGIPREQAQAWNWPTDRRYVPETIEEKIVCHADNLTSGTTYVTIEDVIDKLHEKGLDEVVEPMGKLHRELEEALGRSLDAEELATASRER